MPWSNTHMGYLKHTKIIKDQTNRDIEIWELMNVPNPLHLSAWARHFRNHYCRDSEIDFFRKGPKLTRSEFLEQFKFPDSTDAPGPSIRAGDFGEILIADFLEYVLNYWVPRTRYSDKTIRNESTKGSDIIGFKFSKSSGFSRTDKLAVFEAKAQFSGKKPKQRLQDAIDGSATDITRKAESLNAIKQRLYWSDDRHLADLIERFQNEYDDPYEELYGAAALFDSKLMSEASLQSADSSTHPKQQNLMLIAIHGSNMMKIVGELYQRAADEA